MRMHLIAALAMAGAVASGPVIAQEARQGDRPAAREQVPVPTERERLDATTYRVAYQDVTPRAKRCDNMMCPMFMVLGSGF